MDVIGLTILLIMLTGALWGSMSERREYNNGVCRKTGREWRYFDTDSQGGRGYRSDDHITWVSWPGIDS